MIEQVPSIRRYPKDDDEFAGDLEAAIRSVGHSVDAVCEALRPAYPSVRIAVQTALASRPDEGPVWYCYRDGSLVAHGDGAVPGRDDTPSSSA